MSKVATWSVTAGSNNSSPPDGWPEGMQRSAVNDCAREMMSALAKWYQDSIGTLTTAGGTTAYTLTTNTGYTALSQIPLMSIRFNATNTGAVTLAVDGLTAKSVVKGGAALGAGAVGTNKIYLIAYNVPADRFEILNVGSGDSFAATTAMLFQQTAAPTGWTKAVTHDNKALRLTTGTASSGGSTGFSSIFTSRTIAQANLPSVNLTPSLTAADHSHGAGTFAVGTSVTVSNGTNQLRNTNTDTAGSGVAVNVRQGGTEVNIGATLASGTVTGTSALSGALAVSGTVALGGSDTAMDFAVQYVDVIIALKD